MNARVALYGAVDDEVTYYEVDVESVSLLRRATVKVPVKVQYAWPHPSRRLLYVVTSNRGPGLKSDCNNASAWQITGYGRSVTVGRQATPCGRAS